MSSCVNFTTFVATMVLQAKVLHQILTDVLGGIWWQDILWDKSLSAKDRAFRVINEYTKQLQRYMPYTGYCPVAEKEGKGLKYFITFCSRHPDTMVKMNDIMLDAYDKYMIAEPLKNTLWEGIITGKERKPMTTLETKILEIVSKNKRLCREDVWTQIVVEEFMAYRNSEFLDTIQKMVKQQELGWIDVKGTKRLNDSSLLIIPSNQQTLLF